ncbi:MAG: hypothetical protein HGA42_16220 [Nostocales cyanobacterium W4_Combined_metabat2_030]|nr:hypothetical protein [Nostocales cyanobacterium W4_Combined_metabat2_030]
MCDWYQELARLVNIDIHEDLNKCLYGEFGVVFIFWHVNCY